MKVNLPYANVIENTNTNVDDESLYIDVHCEFAPRFIFKQFNTLTKVLQCGNSKFVLPLMNKVF